MYWMECFMRCILINSANCVKIPKQNISIYWWMLWKLDRLRKSVRWNQPDGRAAPFVFQFMEFRRVLSVWKLRKNCLWLSLWMVVWLCKWNLLFGCDAVLPGCVAQSGRTDADGDDRGGGSRDGTAINGRKKTCLSISAQPRHMDGVHVMKTKKYLFSRSGVKVHS